MLERSPVMCGRKQISMNCFIVLECVNKRRSMIHQYMSLYKLHCPWQQKGITCPGCILMLAMKINWDKQCIAWRSWKTVNTRILEKVFLVPFQFGLGIYIHNTWHIPQAIVSRFWRHLCLTNSTYCSLALTLLWAAAPRCCHGGRGRYSRARALPSTAPCNALWIMLSVGCKAMTQIHKEETTPHSTHSHAQPRQTKTDRSHRLQTLTKAMHWGNTTAIHSKPQHISEKNLREFWHTDSSRSNLHTRL